MGDGIVPAIVGGRRVRRTFALVDDCHLGVRDCGTLRVSYRADDAAVYRLPPHGLRRQRHQTNANRQHRGYRNLFRHFFLPPHGALSYKICRTISWSERPESPVLIKTWYTRWYKRWFFTISI